MPKHSRAYWLLVASALPLAGCALLGHPAAPAGASPPEAASHGQDAPKPAPAQTESAKPEPPLITSAQLTKLVRAELSRQRAQPQQGSGQSTRASRAEPDVRPATIARSTPPRRPAAPRTTKRDALQLRPGIPAPEPAAATVAAAEPLATAEQKSTVDVTTAAPAAGEDHPVRAPVTSADCDCPYDIGPDGKVCGLKSAWSRPGGPNPVCYASTWGRTSLSACSNIRPGPDLLMSFCPHT
jgi:hypothetical protein